MDEQTRTELKAVIDDARARLTTLADIELTENGEIVVTLCGTNQQVVFTHAVTHTF